MKFSSSLKFNAVADWWDEYIAYDTLKKYIYQLEKSQSSNIPPTSPTLRNAERDIEAAEPLLSSSLADESATDKIFIPLLDRELKKVTLFYEHQARELAGELDELKDAIVRQEEMGRVGWDEDEESDEDSVEVSRSPERSRRRGSVSASRARRSAEGKRKGYTAATSPSAAAAGSSHPFPVHPRRYSVSSLSSHEAEDEHTDLLHDAHLVDSLSSLPHPQQPHTHTRTRSLSLSQSLTLPQRGLHRLVTSLKDSITSHPPTATSPSDVVEGEGGGIWTSRSDYAYDTRLLFKRRITTLFIGFTNLKSYVEVNYSGFRKILKKYDKVTYSSLSQTYMHTRVEPSTPFTSTSKSLLNTHLQTLTDLYAKCVTRSDKAAAKSQLRLHQRENVAWERDTVWRTMIARERAHGGVLMEEKGKGAGWKVGKYTLAKGVFWFGVAVLLGLGAVVWWGNEEGRGEEGRCLGILVFCTVLWASEAIPLFVTSLFVPLLLVLLRIVKDGEGNRMSTPDATKFIFSQMFSPTIMLLIGGFTISSALSKSNIDRVLITRVLALAGTRPSTVLLAFMGVSCFASMWISNVAAPTLCFTLIKPILRTLPPRASFAPCLILAIALAANIGGQSSPISSPQNLIAIGEMDPSIDWASWFAVALPVSAISIILIWLLLLASYRPARAPNGEGEIEIKPIRPTKEKFTLKQYWVSFVCITTIVLWCIEHKIESWVGDMGVIALFPIVAFFSTGVLKKDDFERFAWTIVFLAMGGIALGKGVVASGLLDAMDGFVNDLVAGRSLYTVVAILSPIVLIISTFISHTIASVLLVPIASKVGESLPGKPQNLLIFITGLICSTGMGMPVSGFPNQTAATQENELGELYLSNVDFLKNGVPASIVATIVVSTVGFALMRLIGL